MPLIDLDESNIKETINNNKFVLIEFFAPWCSHCRNFTPILEEIETETNGKVAFGKVNTEKEEKLADVFGVNGLPTVFYFKDGKPVDSVPGECKKEAVIEKLKSIGVEF